MQPLFSFLSGFIAPSKVRSGHVVLPTYSDRVIGQQSTYMYSLHRVTKLVRRTFSPRGCHATSLPCNSLLQSATPPPPPPPPSALPALIPFLYGCHPLLPSFPPRVSCRQKKSSFGLSFVSLRSISCLASDLPAVARGVWGRAWGARC